MTMISTRRNYAAESNVPQILFREMQRGVEYRGRAAKYRLCFSDRYKTKVQARQSNLSSERLQRLAGNAFTLQLLNPRPRSCYRPMRKASNETAPFIDNKDRACVPMHGVPRLIVT
jgi:hypothetical protein